MAKTYDERLKLRSITADDRIRTRRYKKRVGSLYRVEAMTIVLFAAWLAGALAAGVFFRQRWMERNDIGMQTGTRR